MCELAVGLIVEATCRSCGAVVEWENLADVRVSDQIGDDGRSRVFGTCPGACSSCGGGLIAVDAYEVETSNAEGVS